MTFTALDGVPYDPDATDVVGRAMSMGNCHRAFPLTVAMCVGVAARIPGTVVHEVASGRSGDIRLGHPSGVLPIDASVTTQNGAPWAEKVTVYRTARRLMEGFVRIP
jgi:2-methylaconitate cis-trans-isomerase PrpF